MDASGRSILMGLLAVAARPLTAPQLIRLAAPLGLTASNLKSHLTRLVADGALQRKGPSRRAGYRPSRAQASVMDGIRARLQDESRERWDGSWLVMVIRSPRRRGPRSRLRASLWFDGWRPLAEETVVRPAWPRRWAQDSARRHAGYCVRGAVVAGAMDPAVLYDLEGLDRDARLLAAWIRRHSADAGSSREAFVLRMEVGGRVARFIGHDPRLPPAIWGQRRGLRNLAAAFRRFESRVGPPAARFLESAIDGR